ncbi:hypothetical protein SS1G_12913 [Sclerotinia sclerotiorum 1980 UF-70]|uniref:Uncharacterized protein n=1 Tax=Sclerotinia sclerotiorum (strain ATCC 18683 / 1980 / Ss-1) TaxID=665079 RepID=A7F5N5_SCLS1|nr:hypothetical protein SS1G_12913 [Sclerotinia sclerotiorum 1980 UF-70]EDN98056.1 hypothetical protein SS1G_12913 [Sclerotinia sclerotiorum 1980 UF-70]
MSYVTQVVRSTEDRKGRAPNCSVLNIDNL